MSDDEKHAVIGQRFANLKAHREHLLCLRAKAKKFAGSLHQAADSIDDPTAHQPQIILLEERTQLQTDMLQTERKITEIEKELTDLGYATFLGHPKIQLRST